MKRRTRGQQEELSSDLVSCDFSPWSLPLQCALTAAIHAPYWASIGNSGMDCMNK